MADDHEREPEVSVPVFISYSHDSDEHREQVLGLSERLRADGIETVLDQYVNGSPAEGWPRWMLDQLDAARLRARRLHGDLLPPLPRA